MKYLATAFFLLTMMTITVSCSKDDGDNVSKNSSDPRGKGDDDDQAEKNNKGDKSDIYNVGQYEYYGTWKINDSTVVADNFDWLSYDYIRQFPHKADILCYDPFSNYITFNTESEPYIGFGEFPIKALIHKWFPQLDIAYIIFSYPTYDIYDTPMEPQSEIYAFLHKIFQEYKEEGEEDVYRAFRSTFISPSGMSENTLYYELNSLKTSVYRHYTFVVTTKDDDYFGLSFNIYAPGNSLLFYDRQTEMIILSLFMPSVDVIGKDGTRTTERLSPEYTITFTSNKIKKHVGN